ncbi:ATP-binding protein [Actinomadura viridis]
MHVQRIQPSPEVSGHPAEIPIGGACARLLPPDARSANTARSFVQAVMHRLGMARELIENGTLAVSELATNAYRLAEGLDPCTRTVSPELWIWARSYPHQALVVTVFDGYQTPPPQETGSALWAEHGRGLNIVAAVSSSWGSHPSRARFTSPPVIGKAVWFTLPLPPTWRHRTRIADPRRTAVQLHALLAARGIGGIIRKDARAVSLVSVPCGLNIRVQPTTFTLNDTNGVTIRRPLVDLHDLAELVVQRTEEITP